MSEKIQSHYKSLIAEAGFPGKLLRAYYERHWPGPKAPDKLDRMKISIEQQLVIGATCLLMGAKGTGKTFMAVSLGVGFCTRCYTVRYVTAEGFIRRMESSRSSRETNPEAVYQEYRAPRLLILDEVSVMRRSDFARDQFRSLVCERHDNEKPTLLITNGTLEATQEAITDAVTDRVNETQSVWKTNWPSFRTSAKN